MKENTIDREAPASLIAAKFGNPNKLGKATGKSPATVHRWITNGRIPPKDEPCVIAAAKREGIPFGPLDFVDLRMFA